MAETANEHDADAEPSIEGIVYVYEDDRHLIELCGDGDSHTFEIANEDVAAGLKGIGAQILSEMDSPLETAATSPAEAERRQAALEKLAEESDD